MALTYQINDLMDSLRIYANVALEIRWEPPAVSDCDSLSICDWEVQEKDKEARARIASSLWHATVTVGCLASGTKVDIALHNAVWLGARVFFNSYHRDDARDAMSVTKECGAFHSPNTTPATWQTMRLAAFAAVERLLEDLMQLRSVRESAAAVWILNTAICPPPPPRKKRLVWRKLSDQIEPASVSETNQTCLVHVPAN
jgi:hypothetical protein